MSKIGLVFAGGGGKGAYQVGVWKALKEFGIDKEVKAVSGTSVGSLNATLFVQGDYEKAEQTWLKISPDKILGIPAEAKQSAFEFLAKNGISSKFPMAGSAIASFLDSAAGRGIFDGKALEALIRESVDLNLVSRSTIPLYATSYNISNASLNYQKLNGLAPDEIVFWLLASAAIPIIFDQKDKDGHSFVDGGLPIIGDNTPVVKVVEEGCDIVLSVQLDRTSLFDINRQLYPKTSFWNIVPSRDTGGALGVLNFKAEHARDLIEMGYNDAVKTLETMFEFLATENNLIKNAEELGQLHNGFKTLVTDFKPLREHAIRSGITFPKEAGSLEIMLRLPANNKTIATPNFKDQMKALDDIIDAGEKIIMSEAVDDWIDSLKENSKVLLSQAFEALGSIQTAKNRTRGLQDQNFFERIFSSLSGKNQAIQCEIDLDQNRAIYANTLMIQKLGQRGVLTLDAIISLGNKINYQMAHINKLYGLQSQYYASLGFLKGMLSSLAEEIQKKYESLERRIDNHEKRLGLLEWMNTVQHRYQNNTEVEKTFLLIRDFYLLTEDIYNPEDILLFWTVLEKAHIPLGKQIDDQTVLQEWEASTARTGYWSALSPERFFPIEPQLRPHQPLLATLESMTESGQLVLREPVDVTWKEFATCIFSGLRLADKKRDFHTGLIRESMKDRWIRSLTAIQEYLVEAELEEQWVSRIYELIQDCKTFEIIVPMVGIFSAGKSRLLNAWLGTDILGTDTQPKTSIPTEIRYGERQKTIAVYPEGEKELSPSAIQNIDKLEPQPSFIKLKLPLFKLACRKDLVLVDMPGLDSNQEIHTKALMNYIHRGHHFILTVHPNSAFDNNVHTFLRELSQYDQTVSAIVTRRKSRPPKEIKAICDELSNFLEGKFQQDSFVGAVESGETGRDIHDFEDAINRLYSKKEAIMELFLGAKIQKLRANLQEYFRKLLSEDNKTLEELEYEILRMEKESNKTREKMQLHIHSLGDRLLKTGLNTVVNNVQNTLNGNIGTLTHSALVSNESLKGSITSLVRSVIVVGLETIIKKEIAKLNENLSLMVDASLPQLNISITMKDGLFAGIFGKNALTKFLDDIWESLSGRDRTAEAQAQIIDTVIPRVVEDIRGTLSNTLETMKIEIEKEFQKEITQRTNELLSAMGEKKKRLEEGKAAYEGQRNKWQECHDKIMEQAL